MVKEITSFLEHLNLTKAEENNIGNEKELSLDPKLIKSKEINQAQRN